MKQEKAAAILTLKDANKMTKAGRRKVAEWLRRQASFLCSDGDQLSGFFRARYLYRKEKA